MTSLPQSLTLAVSDSSDVSEPYSAPVDAMAISVFLDSGSGSPVNGDSPLAHSRYQPLPAPTPHIAPDSYFQSGDLVFVVPGTAAHTTATGHRCSSRSNLVEVYSLRAMTCLLTLRGHDSPVDHVYCDPWCQSSGYLLTQTQTGACYLWYLGDGQLEEQFDRGSEWLSIFLMTRRLMPLMKLDSLASLTVTDADTNGHTNSIIGMGIQSQSQDDDTKMDAGKSTEVCFYENQRFYPLLGWSNKLLPTDRPSLSNETGTLARSKKSFRLLGHWQWTDRWHCVRDDLTDIDGWSYAIDFLGTKKFFQGYHRKTFLHSVRRRKWVRHREPVRVDSDSVRHNSLQKLMGERKHSSATLTQSLSHAALHHYAHQSQSPSASPSRSARFSDDSRLVAVNGAESSLSPMKEHRPSPISIESKAKRKLHVTKPLLSPTPQHSRAGSLSTPSSPLPAPVVPLSVSSMLAKVKLHPDELKQALKRVLLSRKVEVHSNHSNNHHGSHRTKPPLATTKSQSQSQPQSGHSSSSNKPRRVRHEKLYVDDSKEIESNSLASDTHTVVVKPVQKRRVRQSQNELNATMLDFYAESLQKPMPLAPSTSSPPVFTAPSAPASAALRPFDAIQPLKSETADRPPLPAPIIRVEVYENQRQWPLVGWSSRLLPTDPFPPFSDIDGHVYATQVADAQLEPNMQWLSDWAIKINDNTDSDGWRYSIDWSVEFSARSRVLTTVRRRVWYREKTLRRGGPDIGDLAEKQRQRRGRAKDRRATAMPGTLSAVHGVGAAGGFVVVNTKRSKSAHREYHPRDKPEDL